MWAALKSDVIEFVVYEGFRDYYPKWFNDAITDYITYDEDYECAILQSRDADPIVLVEGDIFLVNKHGDVGCSVRTNPQPCRSPFRTPPSSSAIHLRVC